MFYKLGIEFFNGSITTLATDRFNSARTFTKLGAAQGINQAAQCVGAILIAPLVKKWATRTILAGAIIFFAIMTTILLIVDATSGGKMKPEDSPTPLYGNWNPNIIFGIWTLTGVAYGMVELIRRVLPADIVGTHVGKLRRMDATVHIFYEITGTAGAFASSAAISRFGNNYSFFLTPVFFFIAGAIWIFVSAPTYGTDFDTEESTLSKLEREAYNSASYFSQLIFGFVHFFQSIWLGTKIVMGNRRFIWLFPSYALALYLHRFLENNLAPAFAKRVLGTSAWSQIIVGGSNFGELLGALSVFVLSDRVTTPLPWLRVDALMLNLTWLLPYFSTIATTDVRWAWITAVCFIPISFGWAAGDVSLAAYIQASLAGADFGHSHISALGAVMAYLYSTYIVLNAVLSALLGKVMDKDFTIHQNIYTALAHVGGVQFSVCCGIIFFSTFIPIGGFALNPKILGGAVTRDAADADDDDNYSYRMGVDDTGSRPSISMKDIPHPPPRAL